MRGKDSPDKRFPLIDVVFDSQEEYKTKFADDSADIRSLTALAFTKMRGAIRSAYRRDPALTELKSTLANNDFTCWTMKNDDLESLMKFDMVF